MLKMRAFRVTPSNQASLLSLGDEMAASRVSAVDPFPVGTRHIDCLGRFSTGKTMIPAQALREARFRLCFLTKSAESAHENYWDYPDRDRRSGAGA